MDTAKDKARLDDLHASGKPPWYVWNSNGNGNGHVSLNPKTNGLSHIGMNGHAPASGLVNSYAIGNSDRDVVHR
jgi:hypothetical protein